MNQHDQEQRETFRHAPQQGRIAPRLMDEIGDRQKPRPMQIDGDAEKLEEPDGALARWHVARTYHTLACDKQDFWRCRILFQTRSSRREEAQYFRFTTSDLRDVHGFQVDS
jgi:hypothetical protein